MTRHAKTERLIEAAIDILRAHRPMAARQDALLAIIAEASRVEAAP